MTAARGPGALAGLALLCIGLLAVALRALGWEHVFVEDGTVVFELGDAQYHARLALYSFVHFPRFLAFDPYLHHPEGAYVPYPPLLPLLLAGVARLLGGGAATLERVVAWAPVVFGALTVLPVFALGLRLGGRGVGLVAAGLLALLPLAGELSRVGYADHHAAVACLNALLLWLCAVVLDDRSSAPAVRAAFAGLALVRAALVLTWQGSLLHLGLAEVAVVATGAIRGRPALLLGQSASGLAAALLVLPWVPLTGQPLLGPFSAIELSYLQPLFLLAVAGVAAALATLEVRRPAASAPAALGRAALLAAVASALALLLPRAGESLASVIGFLGKSDAYGANFERLPLLPQLPMGSAPRAHARLGWLVYAIPLTPLALLAVARDAARRPAALLLAAWAAVSGSLALLQMRFGNDFAPVGCVGFALLAREAARALARWTRLPVTVARLGAAVLLAGLVWPVVPLYHGPLALRGEARADGPERVDRALATPSGTLVRFAQQVRAATPESGDWLAPRAPDYGVLAFPVLGHALHYYARRATPADNFGPYLGPERFLEVRGFFELPSEPPALATALRLRARYVITTDFDVPDRPMLAVQLHRSDGSVRGDAPALAHFRLVTEGPAGGRRLFPRGSRRDMPPYKLFEIVPGAALRIHAPEGSAVGASVAVRTPLGREFRYRARGRSGPRGLAEIRVPYATDSSLPTRPLGPYRVELDGRIREVLVPETLVRSGGAIDVRF